MNSSYLNKDLDYGEILKTICYLKEPKLIIEFGILEGYSLDKFIENTNNNTKIKAYDIFDKFNGNHADIILMKKKYEIFKNVEILEGNFYDSNKIINNIDILHIDIANDKNVYDYAIKNYLPKLSNNGIMIFEGGSKERDEVYWMNKYNKEKINPYLENLDVKIIGQNPSMTIIRKNILN